MKTRGRGTLYAVAVLGVIQLTSDSMPKAEARAQATPPKSESKSKSYKDARLGFEIPIPEGWEARAREGGPAVLEMTLPGSEDTAFVLVSQPLAPELVLHATAWEDRLKEIIAQLGKSLGGELSVTRREEGSCCGHPAFLVTYARKGATPIGLLQYMIVTAGRSYVLTWTAPEAQFAKLTPVFEQTSKAFAIRKAEIAPAPPPPPKAPPKPAAPTFKEGEVNKTLKPFTHPHLGFSLPLPGEWKVESYPRVVVSGATVLEVAAIQDSRIGGSVRVDPTPASLKGATPDWTSVHPAQGGATRREGMCGTYPALTVIPDPVPSNPVRAYLFFVATPQELFRFEWKCPVQDFPILQSVFEECCRGFAPGTPKKASAPAPAPAARPRFDPSIFPTVHQDKDLGYSLPIPAGWKVEPRARAGAESVILALSDRATGATGSVTISATPSGLKEAKPRWTEFLNDVSKSQEAKGWQGVKTALEREDACCGHAAARVLWTYRVDGRLFNRLSYYVVGPDTLYHVEWTFGPNRLGMLNLLFDSACRGLTVPEKK